MKLTELRIAPQISYSAVCKTNPLKCTVKLASEMATVETVLSENDMHEILRLVQRIVADAAERNVAEFVNYVTALEAPDRAGTIEGPI